MRAYRRLLAPAAAVLLAVFTPPLVAHGQGTKYGAAYLETKGLQHFFFANGNFSVPSDLVGTLPSMRHGGYDYFEAVRIWVCAVDDTGGVRVSGLPYYLDTRSEWGPPADAPGKDYSGELHADALRLPSDTLAFFPLVAHNTMEATWPLGPYGFRRWPGAYLRLASGGFRKEYEWLANRQVYFRLVDELYAEIPAFVAAGGRVSSPPGEPIGVEVRVDAFAFDEAYAGEFLIYRLQLHRTRPEPDTLRRVWIGLLVFMGTPSFPRGWWARYYRLEWIPVAGREIPLAWCGHLVGTVRPEAAAGACTRFPGPGSPQV